MNFRRRSAQSTPSRSAKRISSSSRRKTFALELLEQRELLTLNVVPLTGTIGAPLSAVPVATFVGTDLALPPGGTYTADIDWGDNTTHSTVSPVLTNSATNTYSIYGSHTFAASASFPVVVTVSTTPGSTAIVGSANAAIGTDPSPTISSIPVSGQLTGTQFTADLATITDKDALLATSNFTALINWGDGSAATTATLTASGTPGVFVISGTHTYNKIPQNPTVTVYRNSDNTTFGPSNLAITVSAAAPTGSALPITTTLGAPLTNVSVATFTDANTSLKNTDFSATINWGDGSPVTTNAIIIPNATGFTVQGTHTYFVNPGLSAQTTVTITRLTDNAVVVVNGTVTVSPDPAPTITPLPVSVTTGTALTSIPIATFTDANVNLTGSSFTAVINWGDSTSTSTIIPTGSNGFFTISGTHIYNAIPKTTPTLMLFRNSDSTSYGPSNLTITVTAAPPTGSGVPVTTTLGAPLTNVSVATFADPNASLKNSDFSATIDWGDGTAVTTNAFIIPNGTGFAVLGTHTYATNPGPNAHTTVTIAHTADTAKLVVNGSVTVNPDPAPTITPIPITVAAGTALNSVAIATFTDANVNLVGSNFTAVIDWGDSTSTSSVSPTLSNGLFTISGTHTYNVVPKTTPTVKLFRTSDNTNYGPSNLAITVTDTAPTGSALPISTTLGTALTNIAVATFTDANTSLKNTDFSATINWGDGSPPTTSATITANASGFTVTGSHTYSINPGPGAQTTVTITRLTDNAVLVVHGSVVALNADPAPTITAIPVTVAVGAAISQDTVLATIVDANSSLTAAQFQVVIDWGDFTTSTGVLAPSTGNSGRFTVTSKDTHTYNLPLPSPFAPTIRLVRLTDGVAETEPLAITVGVGPTNDPAPTPQAVPAQFFVGKAATKSLARFLDANTALKASDFSATIQWGDNTTSLGRVVLISAGVFEVEGTHNYASAQTFNAANAKVTVYRLADGKSGFVTPAINVGFDTSTLTFTAQLSSSTGNFTRNNQPQFTGTAQPYSLVQLFGQTNALPNPFGIGEALANADGTWTILVAHPLPDGVYQISGTVVGSSGVPVTSQQFQPIVIDTVGPRVVGATSNPANHTITLTVYDSLSGIDVRSVANQLAYSLTYSGSSALTRKLYSHPIFVSLQSGNPQYAVVTLSISPQQQRSLKSLIVGRSVVDLAGNSLSANGAAIVFSAGRIKNVKSAKVSKHSVPNFKRH